LTILSQHTTDVMWMAGLVISRAFNQLDQYVSSPGHSTGPTVMQNSLFLPWQWPKT